ncbi:hypothetical protein GO986_03475 [Deinococcus sp. HMF7620]|uniref:Bacterial transcriptional activator domain-containing protein n=1 Tax=Deinococcus arboris TaxID=2682977 RepID=A0A7C9LPA1_9DEIO|nr:hypothetical protein [Deinococcus arboris]
MRKAVAPVPVDLARRVVAALRPVQSRRAAAPQLLWGEAGRGKTHLAQQVLAALGCRTLTVQADVAPAALAALVPGAGGWAERLLRRAAAGEALEPAALAGALLSALGTLAPVVLLVEDLHTGTPARAALWSELARQSAHKRGVGVLGTSRQPQGEADPWCGWPVPPQSPAALAALLERQADAPLPPAAAEWITARAQGNPLFALEYFRLLTRSRQLWNDGQGWRWQAPGSDPLPDTIEALLGQAVRVEDPDAEVLLGAAALLSPEQRADPEVWRAVAGLSAPAFAQARDLLETRGLLAGPLFVHPLYGEVVRRDLPAPVHRTLAGRALQVLSDPRARAPFVPSAALDPAQARDLLAQAAHAAEAAGAGQEAAGHWAAHLATLAPPDPARPGAAVRTALAWQPYDPARAEGYAALLDTMPQATPEQRLDMWLLRAELLWEQGRPAEASALMASLGGGAPGQARWHHKQVQLLGMGQDFAAAAEQWAAAPNLQAGAPPATLYVVGDALMRLGRTDEAAATLSGALDRCGVDPLARAELWMAYAGVAYHQGQPDLALERLSSALALLGTLPGDSPDRDLQRARELAVTQRAFLRLAQGDYAGAGQDFAAAVTATEVLGNPYRLAQREAYLGSTLVQLGRYDEAEATLLRAADVLEAQGDQMYLVMVAKQALVTLNLEAERPHGLARAQKHARDALRSARASGAATIVASALLSAARVEAAQGAEAPTLALLDEHDRLVGAPAADALTVRGLLLERLGRPAEAEAALARSQAALRAQGQTAGADLAALALARVQGDAAALHALLARLEAQGGGHTAALTRRALSELGAPGTAAPPHLMPAPATAGCRVEVLGPLRVVVGGEVVRVAGGLRREVLARLALARLTGQDSLSARALALGLPDDPDAQTEADALNRLQQVVYHLRRALGAASVRTTLGGYALGDVMCDAETFLHTRDLSLWRGPLLDGLDSEQGADAADLLYAALHSAADAALAHDPREAARAGRILLQADPYDRAALALTLRALRASGNRKGALATYQSAAARFAEVGETLPPAWQDFLDERPAG